MPKKQGRLKFKENNTPEGLANKEIGQHRNKGAHAAIREFIQNSLDAAREAGRKPAIVQFSIRSIEKDQIPGIDEYETAFEGVRDYLKRSKMNTGQNKNIADAIANELKRSTLKIMQVSDNGIGLDDPRMTALLGDGASNKQQGAGSHGVGHYTAFGLSNLRYILYGGVCENGKKTAAGHAILASHQIEEKPRGKDGYYLVGMKQDLFDPYIFVKDEIPPLLEEPLEAIREKYSSGSIVAVLGFNFFGEDEPNGMQRKIEEVAAVNFFPAIHQGHLVVKVVDERGRETEIGCAALDQIFSQVSSQTRSAERGFPSGKKASESYETLKVGTKHTMSIGNGGERVDIYVREDAQYSTNIALCRNGMWITDTYRPFGKDGLAKKIQFDALLLVEDQIAGKVGQVIRDSETPLHNELDTKLLEGNQEAKRTLRGFAKRIKEFLEQNVSDYEGKEWDVADFISVDRGSSVGESLRGGYVGGGERVQPLPPNPDPPEPNPAPNIRIVPVEVLRLPSQQGISLLAVPERGCDQAEVRVTIDGGSDESCASMQSDYLPFREARIGDRKLRPAQRELKNGRIQTIGFIVDELRAQQEMEIKIDLDDQAVSSMVTIICEFREVTPINDATTG